MYTTARAGTKVSEGLKMVLEEHGISTADKGAEWMHESLAKHSDVKNEKSRIEKMLIHRGHNPSFLPKFHPELNPIERV